MALSHINVFLPLHINAVQKKCSFTKSKKGKRQRTKPTNDIAIYDDCVSYRGTEYTCILLFLKRNNNNHKNVGLNCIFLMLMHF